MLSVVETRADFSDDTLLSAPRSQKDAAANLPTGPKGATPDRFGANRTPNLPVIAVILILHAALIFALVQVRQHVVRAREAKLTVVNLTPPPPPPAAEEPPPPPVKPEVVAPPPIVRTPVPPVQQVATTPDPAPSTPSPAPVAAPPAPVAVAVPSSTIQAGDIGTQMVSGKPPRYPVESRRKREQGTVVLSITLGLDGGVESITVARSSGFRRLDDAARDAVRGWRWKPTVRDGQAVRVRGVVEIPFVLRIDAA